VAKVAISKIPVKGPIRKTLLNETGKKIEQCGVEFAVYVTIVRTSCATSGKRHWLPFDTTDGPFVFRI
jgi:hypothetical protein